MNDDELDQRLRVAGQAWRSGHVPAEVEVPDGPRRRGWVVPVAAAAAVALLAGGAVAIASQLDSDRADAPPADTKGDRWDPDLPPGLVPADVPGAVPPVNQPVEFPKVEVSGTYTPRLWEGAQAPSCGADDVSLAAEPGDTPGAFALTLTARRDDVRCSVSRQPLLQFLRGGKHVEVLSEEVNPRAGDWPTSVVVTPDQRAVLEAGWVGYCRDQGPVFDTIELVHDDNSVQRVAAPPLPECPVTDFADDRLHTVGWTPEGFTFEPRDEFGPVEARLVDTVKGPGGLPTWVVELKAKRDVFLDTCPSWQVRKGDDVGVASWRLNCDGAPDHKPDGRPYLPAGKPVRFAIWVPDGDSQAPLLWVLRTPEGSVSVLLSGGPPAPTGEPRRVAEDDANVHLWLSNQSFDDPTVQVTVEVDGIELVDEELEVEGQHNFVDFHLALPVGEHRILVTSGSGARLARTIDVPARGDRWAAALYWSKEEVPTFDWMWQDSPIGWA